ncbi:hypothetical protein GLOTRDRAFT_138131 [Gloeophyllum trabeum ATCC 11539]|uniref:VLRF1 domain-containing protein n=1 Tax=Gloeophyllum trabeum (strain ATCC 11539 / FP-39264 / Madison 617) TaxID=670483 RepID=S7QA49_GLOTA|nr:uncharacterized protein GLOTRDRAFT_138131 [Gloeophyllum trabeum ATCC 11539]EPQ56392.1 hypothetical protein GLOTRDRAFT_138131 [Gloeophyllum trabeum ATCC 11539]
MARYEQYHVYSLPQELLATLTPRSLLTEGPPKPPTPDLSEAASTAGPGGRSCNICLGATFSDVDEQRIHFRSDWHRYNVKSRLNGGKAVGEAEFARLMESLDDSLSGSASSSEDDGESDDSDAITNLVNQREKQARSLSPIPEAPKMRQTALVWFHSPPSTQIGIYKAIFPLSATPSSYLDELRDMQNRVADGRTWAVFMVAGGHFAGAIVRVQRSEDDQEDETKTKKGKQRVPKPDVEVLKHKTFHRYTTRRKQGGSQSLNDKSKGAAISAGAQLRRYGEQALRDDIRNLLNDWSEDIHDCERIWIRANTSNRRIFLDYEGSPIAKGDERLRTFPFPTRRPTQAELSRCLMELTRVKVSHFTEEELKAQDEAYLASLPKPKPQPVPAVPAPAPEKPTRPKLSKEEEALRDKWERLVEMVTKGRLEPLKGFWQREGANLGGVDVLIPEFVGERRTLLQLATQTGQEEVTQWLLEEAHADPTVEVPSVEGHEDGETKEDEGSSAKARSRRTAYDLARTKEVRNVFRRCAAAHPDWWDWLVAAHVPSVLTQEMEEEQEEKKKVRRKGLKDKLRERQAKEKEREVESPPPLPAEPQVAQAPRSQDTTGPRKLGGAAGAVDGIAGLTPEMRAKVERERRARAAEARLKRLGG